MSIYGDVLPSLLFVYNSYILCDDDKTKDDILPILDMVDLPLLSYFVLLSAM